MIHRRCVVLAASICGLFAVATESALGQASSGSPDPGHTGGGSCSPSSVTPGQGAPTDTHDNPGPVIDIPLTCLDYVAGISLRDLRPVAPDGIIMSPPPGDPAEPGPPIICGFSDSDPVCAGGTRAASTVNTNLIANDGPSQGWGWFQESRPELVVDDADTPTVVQLVLGMRKVLNFNVVSGTSNSVFVGANGVQGVVTREDGADNELDGLPELYHYYDTTGRIWTFFGYQVQTGWLDPAGAKGQLWTAADGDGNGKLTYTGDASDAAQALANGFEQSGGHATPRATYVFDGSGHRRVYAYGDLYSGSSHRVLNSITVESGSGTSWTQQWQVSFDYYTSDETGKGSKGDLQKVTTTVPLSSGGNDVRVSYFRYYTDSSSPDLRHLMKLRVDPEGVRRYNAAYPSTAITSADDSTLKGYSTAYYEYNADGTVSYLLTSAGCGCGGGAGVYEFTHTTQTPSGTYVAAGTTGTGNWAYTRWASKTVITRPDDLTVTLFFDEMGWLLGKVYTDTCSDSWIWKYTRDGYGRVLEEYSPEAMDASSSIFSGGTGDGTLAVKTSGSGLVKGTTYYAPSSGNNYLLGAVASRTVREVSSSTPTTLESYTYVDPTGSSPAVKSFGSSAARLAKHLMATRTVYRDTSVTDVTSYSYSYHSGSSSWAVKSRTATLPSLASGDQSGPSSVTMATYLDDRGRVVMSEDGEGVFSYTKYDATSGYVTKQVASANSASDSDVSSAASTFGLSGGTLSTGLSYATSFSYDGQGRGISITLPSGRVEKMFYTALADGRLVTLSVPRFASSTYSGPVQYTVQNQANKVEAQGTIALSGGSTSSGMSTWVSSSSSDVIGAVSTGSLTHLTVNLYDDHGLYVQTSQLFNQIPTSYSAATSGQHEDTNYKYDNVGRVRRVKDPTGTISKSVFDQLGRLTERWVGTNDADETGTDDIVKVESRVYDLTGVGNGMLTSVTSYPDSGSGTSRTTMYTYDYRGRLLTQENPAAPHAMFGLDNTGHVTAVGQYSSMPSSWSDPTSTSTNRVALSETVYNSRGQVWQQIRHEITQSSGASADTMTASSWYDGAGRVIKADGGGVTKTTYDQLGRATHTYVLGANNDSGYADAAGVSGDKVLEERQSVYDDSAKTGNLLMSVVIQRHPEDTSTTGTLDAVGDADDVVNMSSGSFHGRAQITSYYYDDLDRPTATVALGTNAGTTYTRSSDSSVGTRSASRLITSTTYDADGAVAYTTDPRGKVTQFTYDAAGRTTKTIANYDDGTPGGTNGDEDQVTQYAYTNGLLASLTAKLPGSGNDQTTTYTYGVTTSGTLPSDLVSNRLLRQVTYPESTGSSDVVRYAYNRLGQQTGTIDEAGNQIDTSYDELGRMTSRAVSNLATGFDGYVRRIDTVYLDRGPVKTVTQYGDTSATTLRDQVLFRYDGWGNLEHFSQDVDSAMSDTTGASSSDRSAFDVQDTYANSQPTGGAAMIRRTTQVLSAGGTTFEQVNYSYGTSTGINDLAGRVESVSVGSSSPPTVASYAYLGAARLVGTTLDQAALVSAVYSGTTYAGLDDFNRPTTWYWERIGGAAGGFYNTTIAYDENSNPTSTIDNVHVRASTSTRPFDVVYALDGLNRLTMADEGNASGSPLAISSRTRKELWNSLSLTGNWGNRQLDANGDGDYTDEADRDEPSGNNTFDKENEWTARRIDKGGGYHDDYAYTYDATGNLTVESTTIVRSGGTAYGRRGFVYDAFGRMTQSTGQLVEGEPSVVTNYRYNGLGMRIMWQSDLDADGTLEDSERTYAAYDARWRVVATFANDAATPTEAFVHHAAGFGGSGGSSYIDSVILRDRDADADESHTLEERRYFCQNWRADVVAVTKSDGTPVEYVRYSAYGEPTVYPIADVNMDGVVDSTDYAIWVNIVAGGAAGAEVVGADLNFDGTADAAESDGYDFYESYDANAGLSGKNHVSSPSVAGRLGYAGYEWDDVLKADHVRNRVYFPDIGRWSRRDPAGYDDGDNLYEYTNDQPVALADSMGFCGEQCGNLSAALYPPDSPRWPGGIGPGIGPRADPGGEPRLCPGITAPTTSDPDDWRSCPQFANCIGGIRRRIATPPSSNGCGSGVKSKLALLIMYGNDTVTFTACCNNHDFCYGSCGASRKYCDRAFRDCAIQACRSTHKRISIWNPAAPLIYLPQSELRLKCLSSAYQYYIGLRMFGHDPFCDAQTASCVCNSSPPISPPVPFPRRTLPCMPPMGDHFVRPIRRCY